MKLKLKRKDERPPMVRDSLFETDWRRYMCPPPEDLPLLKQHFDGEWFERIDGKSVVQRWVDPDGVGHNRLLFYPAPGYIEELERNEFTKNRDDYFLLLLRILQKHGYADYRGIPGDVTYEDFDKYLSRGPKMQLKLKPKMKLKLKEVG